MKVIINPAYEQLAAFVNTIPQRFDKEGISIHKGRNEIKVFNVEGAIINVKRYKAPIFINRLIYTFIRPAKASRAYSYALKLRSMGFYTPEPVACIITCKGGCICQTYFISLQSPYSRNMYEFGKGPLSGREHILRSLAHYTARLHEAGIYHKDFSPGNILFEDTEEGVRFCLVDINRMAFNPVSVKKGCANFAPLWGKEEMFRLIAGEYAKERKADKEECTAWILYYRNKFWNNYKKTHDITFEL
ncbi:MAG: lipopolysaccharide kinase InaA family protein [Tannerellaceae bacterium]|jgi:serine/threonine protein kinase|nr:lipopolysaccharide kinase InaA family protein [Tannerellaceae bacterium]